MKKILPFLLISSALAESVTYRIADNVPTETVKQIDQAFSEWTKITGTNLKVEKANTGTITFEIGEAGIPFNPDLATRTLINKENEVTKTEIYINQASRLDQNSVFIAEIGDLFGLKTDLGFFPEDRRRIGPEEIQALRTQFPVKGDCSGDGIADISDLILLSNNFGKKSQNNTKLQCDLNNDGKVDQSDLDILKENYQFSALVVEPKPDPAPNTPPAPVVPVAPTQPNAPTTPNQPVNQDPTPVTPTTTAPEPGK